MVRATSVGKEFAKYPSILGGNTPPPAEMFRRRFNKLSSLVILEDAFTLLSVILPSQDITSSSRRDFRQTGIPSENSTFHDCMVGFYLISNGS